MLLNPPVLVIAAGASRRLGRPKQTLEVSKGVNLLTHTITTIQKAGLTNIWVVVGAFGSDVVKSTSKDVKWIQNNEWELGMGKSVSVGISKILDEGSKPEEIMILLCDQPFIDQTVIQNLITEYEQSKKGIVFSVYDNSKSGPPAIFKKRYFDSLLNLNEDKGARAIIQKNISDSSHISFPKGSIDIDTFEDYQNYLESREGKS